MGKKIWANTLALMVLVSTVAACGAEEMNLQLTENGLGNVDSGTDFTIEAVADALPDFIVTKENAYSEGDPFQAIFVRDGETLVARVFPRFEMTSIVGGIAVSDPRVSFKGRASIGDRFADLDGAPVDCVAGLEERSGLALCHDQEFPHVGMIFGGRWDGPDGELPPADVLGDFTLQELSWSAGVL
ncbi:MAG: DUF1131 family protein [Parvibaculum sp.]